MLGWKDKEPLLDCVCNLKLFKLYLNIYYLIDKNFYFEHWVENEKKNDY